MAPTGGQTVDLWSTQKYPKVSKICSACVGIFFRVSYMLNLMFKPTVDPKTFYQTYNYFEMRVTVAPGLKKELNMCLQIEECILRI